MDGWRSFDRMAAGNWGRIFMVFIVRLLYFIPFVIAAVIVGFVTCCLGFFPLVHQLIFAPLYVFDRAYTLYAIDSLGGEYAILSQFEEPEADEKGDGPPLV